MKPNLSLVTSFEKQARHTWQGFTSGLPNLSYGEIGDCFMEDTITHWHFFFFSIALFAL